MADYRTVAIIQARMGSSRLPGKVLLDLGGEPMLARVVERARRAKTVQEVIVATTNQDSDEAIASFCIARGCAHFRGSLHDVLDRYYQTARLYRAQVIVRITADCPLIDPEVIDRTVNAFWGQVESADQELGTGKVIFSESGKDFPFDFVANRLPPPWGRSYPIGLDTEVCSFKALECCWKEAHQPHQREHVMPYLYENSHRFRVLQVNHIPDYGKLRWTVDEVEDLELVRRIFAHFDNRDNFSWRDVLKLFEDKPELALINAGVRHKTFSEVDESLKQ